MPLSHEDRLREEWLKESSIGTHTIDGKVYSLGLHEDWGDAEMIADWWLQHHKAFVESVRQRKEDFKENKSGLGEKEEQFVRLGIDEALDILTLPINKEELK